MNFSGEMVPFLTLHFTLNFVQIYNICYVIVDVDLFSLDSELKKLITISKSK